MPMSPEQLQSVVTTWNPGANKVAVCFSGQIRTWRRCADTWRHILEHEGSRDNIDVFCHIWDFNTVPNSVPDYPKVSEPADADEIQAVLDFLKPCRYIIESERSFPAFSKDQAITHGPFISQFYGIMRAANLKRQYEIENDMMYRAVIRARFDAWYPHNMTEFYRAVQPHTMHGFHLGWDSENFRGRMGDIFWIADSDTYDLIADYYINLGSIDRKWFVSDHTRDATPEYVFFHYLKRNRIALQNNHWDIKLMRHSAELSFAKKEGGFEIW
jgi:hypothetical protein